MERAPLGWSRVLWARPPVPVSSVFPRGSLGWITRCAFSHLLHLPHHARLDRARVLPRPLHMRRISPRLGLTARYEPCGRVYGPGAHTTGESPYGFTPVPPSSPEGRGPRAKDDATGGPRCATADPPAPHWSVLTRSTSRQALVAVSTRRVQRQLPRTQHGRAPARRSKSVANC